MAKRAKLRCVVCGHEDFGGLGVWACHTDLDTTPVCRGKCWNKYQAQKLPGVRGDTLQKERARLEEQVTGLREALARRDSQFERSQLAVRALGEIVNAADVTIEMRNFSGARSMLGIARQIYVSSLRDQVAHEPGGCAYAPRPPIPLAHTTKSEGK